MRRALEIDEQSYRPRSPERRQRPQQSGGLLQDTNRLAEAEPLMRRALEIDEQSFGPDHPSVAFRPQQSGGAAGRRVREYEESERLKRRALEIDEHSLRSRSPEGRHPPQQSGAASASHEPARRGRALDAARARHRRGKLRPRSPEASPSASTIWRSSCKRRTGSARPNP